MNKALYFLRKFSIPFLSSPFLFYQSCKYFQLFFMAFLLNLVSDRSKFLLPLQLIVIADFGIDNTDNEWFIYCKIDDEVDNGNK